MRAEPRVAFFPDSFLETNGVGHTARNLAAEALRSETPYLIVHAGPQDGHAVEGAVERVILRRSAVGFRLDEELRHDLLLWRHAGRVLRAVRRFRAEAIHITGPSDIGQLGAFVAWRLKLPLILSWQTNVHEYAGARLARALSYLPSFARTAAATFAQRQSLRIALQLYSRGRVLLAPNEELASLLREATRRPVQLMRRGVDTALFSPEKRARFDQAFTIGYVGRLTPEKNVRFLAALEQALLDVGERDIRFLIVGDGSERSWLEANLRRAHFTGVLKGEPLARRFAEMDAFVFPSATDTFGNVVLEAQASGVPAIVGPDGGPKFIIRDGRTGIVAPGLDGFRDAVRFLKFRPTLRQEMRVAARELALQASWQAVFEEVLGAYRSACATPAKPSHARTAMEATSVS